MNKPLALVTGGTGGIGTAICKRLCREGMRVVATYSGPSRQLAAAQWQSELVEMGFPIETVMMNVSSYEDCVTAAAEIRNRFGEVTVLVNNAGITRDAVMKKMAVEQWSAVIHTNLDSVFNVTHQFIDGMIDQHFGRIINISSINAQKGQFGQVNYSAAKAGIHGFTKALAQEVARKGITVNTISPGYVDTSMIHAMSEEIREKIKAQIPVGRFGEPDDIARMVAFLAAQESSFITGADFAVNGGHYMH